MKHFAILVAVLAYTCAALPAYADSVNLVPPGSSSYSEVYTFPAGSYYAPYYGTGVGLIETETDTGSGYNWFESWDGTTKGAITKFAYDYAEFDGSEYSGSNWTFNSKTDVFSGSFSGPGGKTWYFTETLGTPGAYGSYNEGSYSFQESNLLSGSMTTTPEPGTLALLGTGLFGMAGVLRRKLVRR
ncbi:MAG: PEP-CTERM sorting domain-containing protein [Candidatus Sulfotelmatobacter sp.]